MCGTAFPWDGSRNVAQAAEYRNTCYYNTGVQVPTVVVSWIAKKIHEGCGLVRKSDAILVRQPEAIG